MSPIESLDDFKARVAPDLAMDQPESADAPSASRQPAAAALQVVAASSLAGQPIKPRPWLVRNMIPSRTVTMLGGDGSVGKSTLALQLGLAVASGRDWLGQTPERGPVVFVSAEDDLDELHRRVSEIAASYGVALADLGALHIVPLAGQDAVLGAPEGKAGIIGPTRVWRGLLAVVAAREPRLVILDTLADVFAGNENARQEARQFVGLLRGLAIRQDLAVLLLSHPSLDGLKSGSGTSGSTAWNNSVRSRLYIEKLKDDDGREIDPDLRALRVMKSNYGPAGLEIRLRWDSGCFEAETPASGFGKLAAEAKAERVFLDMLAAFAAQGRDVSAKPSNAYAPTVFAKHPDASGLRKEALESAMERLLSARRVRIEITGPPSKQRSRLIVTPYKQD